MDNQIGMESVECGESSSEMNDVATYEEALELKAQANQAMSENEYEKAKPLYLECLRMCKKLNNDDATQELCKTLYLNLSMCYIHLNDYSKSVSTATSALKQDPTNVKAYYRRGLSRKYLKQLKEARDDFTECLRLDPSNQKAKQELLNLKKQMQSEGQNGMKPFGGMFEKSRGLYEDRERKMAAERERQLAAEKELEEEWKTEMDELKENGKEEIEYDEWKRKRNRKNSTKSAATDSSDSMKASDKESVVSPSPTVSASNPDAIEFDEEEQKIMEETSKMGYCYFRRTLTGEEKRVNDLNKPKLITPSSNGAEEAPASEKSHYAISSWNSAGTTYEEKNMTSWATDHFTAKLKSVEVINTPEDMMKDPATFRQIFADFKGDGEGASAANFDQSRQNVSNLVNKLKKTSASVLSVDNVNGEAHIAVIRGTRRYFFEFSCDVHFEFVFYEALASLIDDKGKSDATSKYTGTYKLIDVANISSDTNDWLKDSRVSLEEKVKPEDKFALDRLMQQFKSALGSSVDQFFEDYRQKS